MCLHSSGSGAGRHWGLPKAEEGPVQLRGQISGWRNLTGADTSSSHLCPEAGVGQAVTWSPDGKGVLLFWDEKGVLQTMTPGSRLREGPVSGQTAETLKVTLGPRWCRGQQCPNAHPDTTHSRRCPGLARTGSVDPRGTRWGGASRAEGMRSEAPEESGGD